MNPVKFGTEDLFMMINVGLLWAVLLGDVDVPVCHGCVVWCGVVLRFRGVECNFCYHFISSHLMERLQ